MTYAGRLDPLASGELLVLTGEECKQKDKYLGLDKTYRVKILFGVATDTHDVLGVVSDKTLSNCHSRVGGNPDVCPESNSESWIPAFAGMTERELVEKASEKIMSCVGKFTQDYPDYSSKTINGKSMFTLAREGEILDSERPTKVVEIFSIKNLKFETIKSIDLNKRIRDKVKSVKGDFRQSEILERWAEFFKLNQREEFLVLEAEIECSSGTYMRSLAQRLGQDLGFGALAWEIERLKISTELTEK